MLNNTFVHLKGVGYATERKIWEGGIRTWKEYLKSWNKLDLPQKKKETILAGIEESVAQLNVKNHRYFNEMLPVKELWRAYKEFEDSTVFLDIETTGLGPLTSDITIIGMFDGKRVNTYIKGINLDGFQFELPRHCVLVTFNGKWFDIPFIQTKYPNVQFDQIHIDLRYFLKRLGYSGGLKNIETKLGIRRSQDVKDMRGIDAVRLWKQYKKGNDRALHLLIKYNMEDIKNLKYLMKFAYKELSAQLLLN
jgi:uncharacterized protein YprB with RNaseH-like and TPR domain